MRIDYILLAAVLYVSFAGEVFSQEPTDPPVRTAVGTVTQVDAVGNIINIRTDSGDMSFIIPDQARKVRETKDIGLLEIGQGHPVIIEYTVIAPGKYKVVSLVDNQPTSSSY
jgi:hypothetical protein